MQGGGPVDSARPALPLLEGRALAFHNGPLSKFITVLHQSMRDERQTILEYNL